MTAQRAQVSRRVVAESPHEVWNAFVALVSSKPGEPFSLEQRPAVLVFWYEAEVQNGGHLQYFSNRGLEEAAETVEALRELGAETQAVVLESALASMPSDVDLSPVSVEEYVGVAREDPHGGFDRAFEEAQPSLRVVLEAYLESHLAAFISIDEDGA
jgi:hypothetical protein